MKSWINFWKLKHYFDLMIVLYNLKKNRSITAHESGSTQKNTDKLLWLWRWILQSWNTNCLRLHWRVFTKCWYVYDFFEFWQNYFFKLLRKKNHAYSYFLLISTEKLKNLNILKLFFDVFFSKKFFLGIL